MEELLKALVGKKIDVNCGSNVAYRGEVVSIENGILKLINEEGQEVFVAADKIAAVCECKDFGSRPGFIV